MNKKKQPIKKKATSKKTSGSVRIETVSKLETNFDTKTQKSGGYLAGMRQMITLRFMVIVAIWTGITYLLVVGIHENYTEIKSYFKPRIKNVASFQNSSISYVDPRDVLKQMMKPSREFVLIDLRDKKDFSKAYIKYSVNVPFTQNSDAFVERVQEKAGRKHIVLMAYSSFSTSGEQAVELLKKEGINADLLKIGWNELYNFPHIWLPEHEWDSFDFRSMLQDDLR